MTTRRQFGTVAALWILVSGTAFGFYSLQQGRWLSREPLGEGASIGLYSYVHNDPINRHDYLGLQDQGDMYPDWWQKYYTGIGSPSMGRLADGGRSMWQDPPTVRGFKAEQAVGVNLPRNFKCIDKFDFSKGFATGVKSMDLKAASYQNPRGLLSRLTSYINRLAGWQGQPESFGGVVIQPSAVTAKQLEVVVAPASVSPMQMAVFNAVAQHGQSVGVGLKVTEVP